MPAPEDNPPLAFSRQAIRTLDRLAVEEFGVPSIVLMENAGRSVAQVACAELERAPAPVLIACGSGNNAGDGLVVARYLHNTGRPVVIALAADPARLSADTAINHRIVSAMGVPIVRAGSGLSAVAVALRSLPAPALAVDALLGTGVSAEVRGDLAQEIDQINLARRQARVARVLAIDLPSGMDADTGLPAGGSSSPCVVADLTVTLVGHKAGFANPGASRWLGTVLVGDIGVPRDLARRVADGPISRREGKTSHPPV